MGERDAMPQSDEYNHVPPKTPFTVDSLSSQAVKKVDVKSPDHATMPTDRTAGLLKTLGHLESQAGRLVKMARDIRAEVVRLTK